MSPDYTRMLRMHMLRWSGVFAMLVVSWIVALSVSLLAGTPVPVLTVSVATVVCVTVSRIRVRQLAQARDEQYIRQLREALEEL